jgi:hypothetical protein
MSLNTTAPRTDLLSRRGSGRVVDRPALWAVSCLWAVMLHSWLTSCGPRLWVAEGLEVSSPPLALLQPEHSVSRGGVIGETTRVPRIWSIERERVYSTDNGWIHGTYMDTFPSSHQVGLNKRADGQYSASWVHA